MGEAVRTSTSTFGIWAIVVVAVVVLAIWLVGISVADNIQTRESRRWWQRLHGPEPVLGSPEPALGGPGSSAVPGQRRGDEDGTERTADSPDASASQEAATSHEAGTPSIPGQAPAPETDPAPESEPGTAAARGRHAKPALDGAGDFRRDAAEADWRTEAPTRPDLPAQAGPSGRHAMPAQRTGDTDRAERSVTGPDPAGTEDESGQQ
jgi:hypothetical protein